MVVLLASLVALAVARVSGESPVAFSESFEKTLSASLATLSQEVQAYPQLQAAVLDVPLDVAGWAKLSPDQVFTKLKLLSDQKADAVQYLVMEDPANRSKLEKFMGDSFDLIVAFADAFESGDCTSGGDSADSSTPAPATTAKGDGASPASPASPGTTPAPSSSPANAPSTPGSPATSPRSAPATAPGSGSVVSPASSGDIAAAAGKSVSGQGVTATLNKPASGSAATPAGAPSAAESSPSSGQKMTVDSLSAEVDKATNASESTGSPASALSTASTNSSNSSPSTDKSASTPALTPTAGSARIVFSTMAAVFAVTTSALVM